MARKRCWRAARSRYLAAQVLVDSADVIASLSLGRAEGTDARLTNAFIGASARRPNPDRGHLRKLLEGQHHSRLPSECGKVQDAYSLRLHPQVHAPCGMRWRIAVRYLKS